MAVVKGYAIVGGAVALSPSSAPGTARAMEAARKLALGWLECQECAGGSESVVRAQCTLSGLS
jgi:Ni,Fe-hydrogenase I small subunit